MNESRQLSAKGFDHFMVFIWSFGCRWPFCDEKLFESSFQCMTGIQAAEIKNSGVNGVKNDRHRTRL